MCLLLLPQSLRRGDMMKGNAVFSPQVVQYPHRSGAKKNELVPVRKRKETAVPFPT